MPRAPAPARRRPGASPTAGACGNLAQHVEKTVGWHHGCVKKHVTVATRENAEPDRDQSAGDMTSDAGGRRAATRSTCRPRRRSVAARCGRCGRTAAAANGYNTIALPIAARVFEAAFGPGAAPGDRGAVDARVEPHRRGQRPLPQRTATASRQLPSAAPEAAVQVGQFTRHDARGRRCESTDIEVRCRFSANLSLHISLTCRDRSLLIDMSARSSHRSVVFFRTARPNDLTRLSTAVVSLGRWRQPYRPCRRCGNGAARSAVAGQ